MARSDYTHWNEEQDLVWWQEEGRHETGEKEYDPDDYLPGDDYDEEVEHDTPEDCIADGNFSRPSATGVWECDGCGRKHPTFGEWPPLKGD